MLSTGGNTAREGNKAGRGGATTFDQPSGHGATKPTRID